MKRKFKVGDRVRFKQWDEMKKEFGLDRDGDIDIKPCFAKGMKGFCGTYATISGFDDNYVELKDFSYDGDSDWQYCTDMLEFVAPFKIEVGYVLECQRDSDKTFLMMVLPSKSDGGLGCSGTEAWFPLHEFNENFCYSDIKIMKIYGYASNCTAHKLSTDDRDLLWKRDDEVKEMTIREIEKELGYQIKIIKED